MTLAQLERQTRQAEREQQITDVRATERALVSLHLECFPMSERTVLASPTDPTAAHRAHVRRDLARQQTKGISLLKWGERARARIEAYALADDLLRRQGIADLISVQREQVEMDGQWRAMQAHDPDHVIEAVDEAFADNASDSTCLDAGYDPATGHRYVTVVVLFGTTEMVPDRKPAVTPGGKPTLHKRTKAERNAFYLRALASTVLATIKEALATAVSTDEVKILVGRPEIDPNTLTHTLPIIYLARFSRADLANVDWATVDPVHLLLSAPDANLVRKGKTAEVVPLDLRDDAALRELADGIARRIQRVDVDA